MNERYLRKLGGYALLGIFCAPFVILILWAFINRQTSTSASAGVLNSDLHMNHKEVFEVFVSTVGQAFVSSVGSIVAGVMGAFGLIAVRQILGTHKRGVWRRFFRIGSWPEWFVLLPNTAPVLLLIIAAMKFMPELTGFWGVVALHISLNVGFVSVVISRLLQLRLGSLADLAWVEGATRWRFFTRGALPMLWHDLVQLGVFVFAFCFTSFAIPLVIGGVHGATVEVLIYRAMRVDGDWSAVLVLALLQMLAILIISLALPQPADRRRHLGVTSNRLLSWGPGFLIVSAPTLLILTSFFDGLGDGVRQFISTPTLAEEWFSQLMGSLFVGCGTGVLVGVWLLLLAFTRPTGGTRRWLLGYAAPSSVLTGLSLLILWRATGVASLVKIVLGLSLIITPAFYRMQWEAWLSALSGQIRVAETLGAGNWLIFRRILLPQLWTPLGTLAGLAALWGWGDFALSSVIAERNMTLGMTVSGLMDSYRLDVATVYVWMIAVGGLLSYAFFAGVGRVLGSESKV